MAKLGWAVLPHLVAVLTTMELYCPNQLADEVEELWEALAQAVPNSSVAQFLKENKDA